ncbi:MULTISPECIES: tyrosine-protein phosphatase [Microbacterium]|uniref:Tyrosine-protein phosphatase n=1 Tax=Microbacterium trichothecenolyticum TaxID=69370 RepID=A0A0M2HEV7_MICTR|nr:MULTISPECIES: tyrosine-protein phosphatase [Microbacterium]KJL45171.1 Tyrosine-protein phosphatase precursor [Microbacterium trichothecenolyticum]MDR7187216.1 protein-tyrosine phosphatase [Microbacterium sp. BE35]
MAIEGLFNFRDTGGMPLTSGGVIRSGVLYRSAALNALTDDGLAQLADTAVGVIADFRTPVEQQMAPDRVPVSRPFRVESLTLLEGALPQPAVGADATAVPESFATVLAQLPTLGELYLSMLAAGAETFAGVARLVGASTDDEPTAVLVHCTAGKDRTGVAVALMLDAAGAERDAIVADYASSQDNLAGPWAEGMLGTLTSMGVPVTDSLRTLVTRTPPAAIEQALTWVDGKGGSAAYLQSGGLTDAELDALRTRLRA